MPDPRQPQSDLPLPAPEEARDVRPGDVRLYGLMITKDDPAALADWCRDQLGHYDAVVCLDGSAGDDTASIAAEYGDKIVLLRERDFDIPHKTDHGLRRVVHEEVVRRFGEGHWVMCCHADEFCYHDPRKIAALAERGGHDLVSWFSPHFYPHPADLADWEERRHLPLPGRFRHYHWDYRGSGLPWAEDRLYRCGPGVAWDGRTHGSVRPHGLSRPAPFRPALRHFKVVEADPALFEREEGCAHYKRRWEGLEHRTGLPFPVRRFEDLFVASVPRYGACDRFDGSFPHPWNMGEAFRPDRDADASHAETAESAEGGLPHTPASPAPAVDFRADYERACGLAGAGDHRAAREAYAALLACGADAGLRALARNDLAALDAAGGDVGGARAGFREALALDPSCAPARANLAALEAAAPAAPAPPAPHPAGAPVPPENSPVRVAVLSLLFNWPSTGGGTVHTAELARFLAGAGYEVKHFYARHEPWGVGGVAEPLPYPSEALVFAEGDWNEDGIRGRFRAALARFRPDSVIVTDSWNTKPLLAEAAAGFPYLLRLQALECLCPLNNVRLLPEPGGPRQCARHQLATPDACRDCVRRRDSSSGPLHRAERALAGFGRGDYPGRLRRAFAGAEAVLVVDPLAAAMVGPYARDVRVVTAGMDPARFPWPPPEPPGESRPGKLRVLFAGLTEEWMKGFHVLREACARLWRCRRDFELVATGEPPAGPAGEAEEFLRYAGWQSQAELPRLLWSCDVLAVPTVAQEALGRTAVEAMAAGKPVVASRIGGLPSTVLDGATGLLCEPGDPDDLARKLGELLDDPELRKRLGEAGRRRFEEHYAWPVIIDRHYRPLLKPRHGSAVLPTSFPEETSAMNQLRDCPARAGEYPMPVRGQTVHVPFAIRGSVDEAIVRDLWLRDAYGLGAVRGPVGCVVDVGAHAGAFTALAKTFWPDCRVVACEADPQNAALLRRNLAGREGVAVVEAAIVEGDTEGEVMLYAVPDKAAGNSGGGSLCRPEPGSVPVRIPAVSVRRLWEEQGITACDLLKLDCEGSEGAVLRGLAAAGLLGSVRRVVGEWHAPDAGEASCKRVWEELRGALEPTHELTFDPRRSGREGPFTAVRRDAPSVAVPEEAAGEQEAGRGVEPAQPLAEAPAGMSEAVTPSNPAPEAAHEAA